MLQIIGSILLGGSLMADARNPRLDLSRLFVPLIPALVWTLVALVPQLALTVRRLHDTDRSGWWYLIVLPALPGYALLIVGLRSLVADQFGAGAVPVGTLVGGGILTLVGGVGAIILLVFMIMGPNPNGARFDRRGAVSG
ncbi:DUF805 domain-containing protein [uncultured Friedmanniella sp.]|uniref:DUF805 domain-containing protein n=1 Tax=uncultured Friedmanniella sp. TaxID=335381 RepID=UPI0035CAE124